MQVSNDTESVIDTDIAGRGIAGIDYRVLGIARHYQAQFTALRWYTTKENFFSDYSSIKTNFCHDVGGVRGTLKMICVS